MFEATELMSVHAVTCHGVYPQRFVKLVPPYPEAMPGQHKAVEVFKQG